jgi:hypothetical protein
MVRAGTLDDLDDLDEVRSLRCSGRLGITIAPVGSKPLTMDVWDQLMTKGIPVFSRQRT